MSTQQGVLTIFSSRFVVLIPEPDLHKAVESTTLGTVGGKWLVIRTYVRSKPTWLLSCIVSKSDRILDVDGAWPLSAPNAVSTEIDENYNGGENEMHLGS